VVKVSTASHAHTAPTGALDVSILPLCDGAVLPTEALAATRPRVPPGYGVQEHCLPFTTATALGLLVRAPITFGFCDPADVPGGAHSFVSPIEPEASTPSDSRVFYVQDDPACSFAGNAFTFTALQEPATGRYVVAPGLSFFDRRDQQHLFKLHLPFIIRTPDTIDTLFTAAINRVAPFEVLSGLVESDWYADPVNLILRKPGPLVSVHVQKGEPVGQLVFLDRPHRGARVTALPAHARLTRSIASQYWEWKQRLHADRSAYKHIVREGLISASRSGSDDA
jgi:uncharacterized protein DUF6065